MGPVVQPPDRKTKTGNTFVHLPLFIALVALMAAPAAAEYEAVVAVEHTNPGITELTTSSELHAYHYSGGRWTSGVLDSSSTGSSISDLVVSEEADGLVVYWKKGTLCYKSTDFITKSLVNCRYHPGTSSSGEVRYDQWNRVEDRDDCGPSSNYCCLWDRPTDTEFTQPIFYVSGDSCSYRYYWTGRPLPASANDALLVLFRTRPASFMLSEAEAKYLLAIRENGGWRYLTEGFSTGYSAAITDFEFGAIEVGETVPQYNDDAECVSTIIIPSIRTNEKKLYTVKMQNTGDTDWVKNEGYKLVSYNNPVGLWGTTEDELNLDTIPGSSNTFIFYITGPSTTGTKYLRWGMSGPNGDFGEVCESSITVEPAVSVCGDGNVDRPNTVGRYEECDGTHGTQAQCDPGYVCDMSDADDPGICVCEARCGAFSDWVSASSPHTSCGVTTANHNPPYTTCVRDSDKDGLYDQQCRKSDQSIINIG